MAAVLRRQTGEAGAMIYGPVLITGGTGSFGHAMTERLLSIQAVSKVIIFSRDEVKQAQMREQFKNDPRLRFFLGDVRDRWRLGEALQGVNHVFHAAALKRIEACAYDPEEAIRTNVVGSMNVRAAAIAAGVGGVVALSSDKACAPSTVYGATKLCMEAVFTSSTSLANRSTGTKFSVIRYGNVAGSRGSVIPTWRAAIKRGERIKVYDPEATRFWFTLDGAVDLALLAVAEMAGGELFVPDLKAFSVGDLARVMGHSDFATLATAIDRPGEKRHESMISSDEAAWFRFRHGMYARYLPGTEPDDAIYVPAPAVSSEYAERMTVSQLAEAVDAI